MRIAKPCTLHQVEMTIHKKSSIKTCSEKGAYLENRQGYKKVHKRVRKNVDIKRSIINSDVINISILIPYLTNNTLIINKKPIKNCITQLSVL